MPNSISVKTNPYIKGAGTIRKVTISEVQHINKNLTRPLAEKLGASVVFHGVTPENKIFEYKVGFHKLNKIPNLAQILEKDLTYKNHKEKIREKTFADPEILSAFNKFYRSAEADLSKISFKNKLLLDENKLDFSLHPTDAMFYSTASADGTWAGGLTGYYKFPIDPASVALNYGQAGFEGIKVRYNDKGELVLFRVEGNGRRMHDLARRLCMAYVPVDYFTDAVTKTVLANKAFVPKNSEQALYVRPLLFGSGGKLGVQPADEYTFLVYVSPVGAYFKNGMTPIDLYVGEDFHRSGPGITGDVKASGNYAPGMYAKKTAQKIHPSISERLYLDANNEFVDEAGAANFFCVKNNVFYTPRLTGTILAGITRDSIIKIARALEYRVEEEDISLGFLKTADEAFCTGTAAVLTPIGRVYSDEGVITFNNGETGELTKKMYDYLAGVQNGKIADTLGWTTVISEK